MIHKFTLNFAHPEYQKRYLEYMKPKFISEMQTFSMFSVMFAILSFILFTIQKNYVYSVGAAASVILIIVFYYAFKSKLSLLNHILAFYQIYAVFALSRIDFLGGSTSRFNQNFVWYYGVQCCFFQFTIYLQGTNYIYQSIMLLFGFIIHQAGGEIYSMEGQINVCIFIFMYLSMAKIKYNYERTKKEDYLYQYQQKKWEELFLEQLPMSIMLIGHDKAQDQLKLLEQSRHCTQEFNIKNGSNMRELLRNLKTSDSKKLVIFSKTVSASLETLVRNQLLSENSAPCVLEEHYETQKYNAIDSRANISYKVKLSNCILNNQLQIIIILERKRQDFYKQQKSISTIMNTITEKAMSLSKYAIYLQTTYSNFGSLKDEYFSYNSCLNISYLLTKRFQQFDFEEIKFNKLNTSLQRIFGKSMRSLSLEASFQTNFQILMQLIVTLARIIYFTHEESLDFVIKIAKNKHFKNHVKVSMIFQNVTNIRILHLLEENWIRFPGNRYKATGIYEQTIERFGAIQSKSSLPEFIILDIIIGQLILSRFGPLNYFEIKTVSLTVTEIGFIICDLNQI